jgi:hypothetical protein
MPVAEWCAICNVWGAHDTAHHAGAGQGLEWAVGDQVQHACNVAFGGCEDCEGAADELVGRVEGVRGKGYVVAFANRGKTITLTISGSRLRKPVPIARP